MNKFFPILAATMFLVTPVFADDNDKETASMVYSDGKQKIYHYLDNKVVVEHSARSYEKSEFCNIHIENKLESQEFVTVSFKENLGLVVKVGFPFDLNPSESRDAIFAPVSFRVGEGEEFFVPAFHLFADDEWHSSLVTTIINPDDIRQFVKDFNEGGKLVVKFENSENFTLGAKFTFPKNLFRKLTACMKVHDE